MLFTTKGETEKESFIFDATDQEAVVEKTGTTETVEYTKNFTVEYTKNFASPDCGAKIGELQHFYCSKGNRNKIFLWSDH